MVIAFEKNNPKEEKITLNYEQVFILFHEVMSLMLVENKDKF